MSSISNIEKIRLEGELSIELHTLSRTSVLLMKQLSRGGVVDSEMAGVTHDLHHVAARIDTIRRRLDNYV